MRQPYSPLHLSSSLAYVRTDLRCLFRRFLSNIFAVINNFIWTMRTPFSHHFCAFSCDEHDEKSMIVIALIDLTDNYLVHSENLLSDSWNLNCCHLWIFVIQFFFLYHSLFFRLAPRKTTATSDHCENIVYNTLHFSTRTHKNRILNWLTSSLYKNSGSVHRKQNDENKKIDSINCKREKKY